MVACAISVPEYDLEPWCEAVGDLRFIRDIEISGTHLDDPGVPELLERTGLGVVHVRDLLPADVSRYINESPAQGRDDVVEHLESMLDRCRAIGAKSAGMEFGLDRITKAGFRHDFTERIRLLRSLVPVADRNGVVLCVNVRFPRSYPGSKEWEHAANLIHEVMHPSFRLAVDLVSGDLPEDFAPEILIRECYFQIGVLRIHFSPAFGETMTGEFQQSAGRALRRHGYRGVVIFRGHFEPNFSVPGRLFSTMDNWAQLMCQA